MAYDSQFKEALAEALKGLASVHAVGEEWVSYTGIIPAGGVPYCGQSVNRSTYSALWDYVLSKQLIVSEADWQQIASSNNGNCPYYSYGDGSTTFRMPKMVGYVKGASSQAEAGAHIHEGLPNITSKSTSGYGLCAWTAADGQTVGAIHGGETGFRPQGGDYGKFLSIDFDAYRSSPIYGNSSHVTPDTSCVLFGVYAFGEVVRTGELDATTLAGEIASVKSSYLPLSGGSMRGKIYRDGEFASATSSSSELVLFGGTTWADGSYFQLYGKDSPNNKGGFQVVARNDNATNVLAASPEGSLTWGGRTVVCVESWHDGLNWYRRYSDGWIEQGGCAWKSSEYEVIINFPTAFVNTNYTIVPESFITVENRTESVTAVIAINSRHTTQVKVIFGNGNGGCYWYACGY